MNFIEAVKLLNEGNVIRRLGLDKNLKEWEDIFGYKKFKSRWVKGELVSVNVRGETGTNNMLNLEDYLADDWEVVKS